MIHYVVIFHTYCSVFSDLPAKIVSLYSERIRHAFVVAKRVTNVNYYRLHAAETDCER